MQRFLFSEKTFQAYLNLFINCSQEELEAYWRKNLGDNKLKLVQDKKLNGCHFLLEKDGDLRRVIWVEKFDWSVRSQATLAHELIHFVWAVLADKDTPVVRDNEETFAYYFDYFYTEIWWKLRKLNPKFKKK